MKVFRNMLVISILLTVAWGCSQKVELTGLWGVTLGFSPYETQITGFTLLKDSTFYYFSRPNNDQPWTFYTGNWMMKSGKLHLSSDVRFNLWLKLIGKELEVLDYEGNERVSDKPVRFAKVAGPPWSNEISLVMTGKILLINSLPYFLPCNSFQPIRIISPTDNVQQIENQMVTARFSVSPEKLILIEDNGLKLESVFGPAECR